MIETAARLATMLDQNGFYQEADLLDNLLLSVRTNLTKSAKKKYKDLAIVATVVPIRLNNGKYEVLIERRVKDPQSHTFALPSGHLEEIEGQQEDFAAAAVRELEEETAIKLDRSELRFLIDKVRTKGKRKREVVFAAIVPMERSDARAGSDASDAEWFKLTEIPKMSFDHNYFVELALKELFKHRGEFKGVSDLHLPCSAHAGLLVAFEGQDGAGKSSQIELLAESLRNNGYKVMTTHWGGSSNLHAAIKKFKEGRELNFQLYSLLYVCDLMDRYINEILPALARGHIVLCDRYVYTSLVRDMARGTDPQLLYRAYNGFRKPDLLVYCDISPEQALERLHKERGIGYYGAGLDLHLSSDPDQNFLEYQHRIVALYSQILSQVNTTVKIPTNRSAKKVSRDIWKIMTKLLQTSHNRIKIKDDGEEQDPEED